MNIYCRIWVWSCFDFEVRASKLVGGFSVIDTIVGRDPQARGLGLIDLVDAHYWLHLMLRQMQYSKRIILGFLHSIFSKGECELMFPTT